MCGLVDNTLGKSGNQCLTRSKCLNWLGYNSRKYLDHFNIFWKISSTMSRFQYWKWQLSNSETTMAKILAFHSPVWHIIFVTLIFFFFLFWLCFISSDIFKPLNLGNDNLLKQLSKQIIQVYAKSISKVQERAKKLSWNSLGFEGTSK